MNEKQNVKSSGKQSALAHPKKTTNKNINQLYQKDGYFDGKVFHSKDKVTYTFLYENEVISLHCDITKHSIFLKGHKITDINAHPNLLLFLEKFKKALVFNSDTQSFVKHFDAILEGLVHPERASHFS